MDHTGCHVDHTGGHVDYTGCHVDHTGGQQLVLVTIRPTRLLGVTRLVVWTVLAVINW
jgi:hypothetical protein